MPSVDRSNLITFLNEYFNDDEIVMLCSVDFRSVFNDFASGQRKSQKVLDLVEWCYRRGEIEKLLAILQRERPIPFSLHLASTTPPVLTQEIEQARPVQSPARLTNSEIKTEIRIHPITGKEMVRIPAGAFLYGENKETRYLDEYWIDKTPVTNAEYGRFVAATNYNPPPHWQGIIPSQKLAYHPVVCVSWTDAQAYATWAGCQLPTEEQWEKAARGVDGREYPWGNDWRENHCNTRESGIIGTSSVGRFSPQGDSPYGCADMSGNAWEWTRYRLWRGGSWFNDSEDAHVASCNFNSPDLSPDSFGFRVVSPVLSGS